MKQKGNWKIILGVRNVGLERVGKAHQSKSGRGIIIELMLPGGVTKHYLVLKRQYLLEVCEGSREETSVSVMTGEK